LGSYTTRKGIIGRPNCPDIPYVEGPPPQRAGVTSTKGGLYSTLSLVLKTGDKKPESVAHVKAFGLAVKESIDCILNTSGYLGIKPHIFLSVLGIGQLPANIHKTTLHRQIQENRVPEFVLVPTKSFTVNWRVVPNHVHIHILRVVFILRVGEFRCQSIFQHTGEGFS
jgi:hypothetical protein